MIEYNYDKLAGRLINIGLFKYSLHSDQFTSL